MMPSTESAMQAAKSLNPGDLLRFLVELKEVELTALLRLNAPPVAPSQPREDPRDMLDVKHIAAYIGMSVKWVYNHRDILPISRIGNGKQPRIRARRRDLDVWLEQHLRRHKRQ